MKKCIKCGADIDDNAAFCRMCGAKQNITSDKSASYNPNPQGENKSNDSAQNQKSDQFALVVVGWILSWIGFFIVEIAGNKKDPFLRFWANQMLVFNLFALIGFIPFIGWIWGIVMIVFWIIGLVYICQNKMDGIPLIGQIHILD